MNSVVSNKEMGWDSLLCMIIEMAYEKCQLL